MAHIGIVSAAYWGDVMPFVPIAEELAARGHRVTLAVPEGFHEALRGHRFELVHLGTDFSPRELAAHGDIMENANTIRGMRAAMDLWVKQMSIDPAAEILAALDRVDADIWIVHNTAFWLVELHAVPREVPVVVGHLFPMMIPSQHQRPPMLPLLSGNALLNRIGWRFGREIVGRQMYDEEINRLKASRGLPPTRANAAFSWERADRVLLLSSQRYWPRPADWPEQLRYTGFTVWGDVDAPLPEDLRSYLEGGEPPIVMTLGTSAAANARDAFRLGADAIEATGRRALLLVGNEANMAALADREDTWMFAPLPAVLARSSAVLHAAGHGTTAAALHAGVPQIAMPQGFDQVEHARRLTRHGVGVHVPWKRRSLRLLQRALEQVASTRLRQRASSMAADLAAENGPAVAADAVEELLQPAA